MRRELAGATGTLPNGTTLRWETLEIGPDVARAIGMIRKVTGPNGVMVVHGQEHLSDEQLIEMAAQLAQRNVYIIQQMRQHLTGYTVRKHDPQEPESVEDTWDRVGSELAEEYGLEYQGVARARSAGEVVYTFDPSLKIFVPIDESAQRMRHELDRTLHQRGFRRRTAE